MTDAIDWKARVKELEGKRDDYKYCAETWHQCAVNLKAKLNAAEAEARKLREALEKLIEDIDTRADAYRNSPQEAVRKHYKNIPLSDGVLCAARAALTADRAAGYHDAIWREAIEAAAKALGPLLHRAPDGVYATAVNDCHTAILALLPAPASAGWQPIETAPKDRLIWVYAQDISSGGMEPLESFVTHCQWHPDAGFCVCELRHATHWHPMIAPPAPAREGERADG